MVSILGNDSENTKEYDGERVGLRALPALRVARTIRNTTSISSAQPSNLKFIPEHVIANAVQDIIDELYGKGVLVLVPGEEIVVSSNSVRYFFTPHPDLTVRRVNVLKLKDPRFIAKFEFEFPNWKDILPK